MEYIAFDCYKRYTWAVVEDEEGANLGGGEDRACTWGTPGVPGRLGAWFTLQKELLGAPALMGDLPLPFDHPPFVFHHRKRVPLVTIERDIPPFPSFGAG